MMNLIDTSLLDGVKIICNDQENRFSDPSFFEVLDPATSKPIAIVPDEGTEACIEAINQAIEAKDKLKNMTARTRAELLHRWYQLTKEAENDISQIITAENGKPLEEAKGEVTYASEFLHWFSGEAQRLDGAVIASSTPNQRVFTLKQPVGVVGIITPWNFPAAMVTRKVGAAIAAGCPCILKPAAETPLTAVALKELASRAGFPSGAFQIITSSSRTAEVGEIFTTHPAIRKFSFTGSTAVGKILAAQCMTTMKRISLELGGNAPALVFDDADLEKAVDGIIQSKFRLSGQTCVCANRVYVQAGIHDCLLQALEDRVRSFKLGPGNEKKTTIGPLISKRAVQKVMSHIDDASLGGARVVVGGKRAESLGEAFVEPTILADVDPAALCAREETFGPLLPIIKFHSEEQVIEMANSTDVGLAGYFFTEDIARIWRVAEGMEVGMIGVNTGRISDVAVPFGGVKESGQGREGSKLGVEEYLEVKSITMKVN